MPDLAHHLTHVIFDALHKRFEVSFAALDARQVRLPLAGHRRALDLGVHNLNEPDSLVNT
jgi:hypothetical protein